MNEKSYENDEEFNNFLHRVTHVEKIMKNLVSGDQNRQEMGIKQADDFLKNDHKEKDDQKIDEENVKLEIKQNRTVINKKSIDTDLNGATTSQLAFMAEVSRDAEKRYKDRLVRKEKMETFKKRAHLAYSRGEYEKALNCYNKAIELIKDDVNLYDNRCTTYMQLGFYSEAINDAKTALELQENHFRSQLLLCKGYFFNGDRKEFEEMIEKTKETNSNRIEFIDDFAKNLGKEINF